MSELLEAEAGYDFTIFDPSERLARMGEAVAVLSGDAHMLVGDPDDSRLLTDTRYKVQRLSDALETIRRNQELLLQPEPGHNGLAFFTDSKKALVVDNLGLVSIVCAKYFAHLPKHIDVSSLYGAGEDGLIDAARRFEADRGLGFSTFAVHRIRGSILDHIRSQDWAPRSLRTHARRIEEAEQILASKLHRAPTVREIAEKVELPTDQVHKLRSMLSGATIVSLSDKNVGAAEGISEDGIDSDPQVLIENKVMLRLLYEALDQLPERSRDIIDSYYFQGHTLGEIADRLGVTESRVSQIMSGITLKLRRML